MAKSKFKVDLTPVETSVSGWWWESRRSLWWASKLSGPVEIRSGRGFFFFFFSLGELSGRAGSRVWEPSPGSSGRAFPCRCSHCCCWLTRPLSNLPPRHLSQVDLDTKVTWKIHVIKITESLSLSFSVSVKAGLWAETELGPLPVHSDFDTNHRVWT